MPRALANINSVLDFTWHLRYTLHNNIAAILWAQESGSQWPQCHNANPAVIERFITAQILEASCSAQPDSLRFELSLGPNSRGLGQILSYFAGYHPGRRILYRNTIRIPLTILSLKLKPTILDLTSDFASIIISAGFIWMIQDPKFRFCQFLYPLARGTSTQKDKNICSVWRKKHA